MEVEEYELKINKLHNGIGAVPFQFRFTKESDAYAPWGKKNDPYPS